MSSTQTHEDVKATPKLQLEDMLRTRIREDLETYLLINIFDSFGFDPMVFAAFGIDLKEVLFEEMETVKNTLKEAVYEVKD